MYREEVGMGSCGRERQGTAIWVALDNSSCLLDSDDGVLEGDLDLLAFRLFIYRQEDICTEGKARESDFSLAHPHT